MSLKDLSPSDQVIVRQCLRAIAQGPFIDDLEFQTRVGVQRDKINSMLHLWPEIDDLRDDCEETLAINNCLNEICYGISIPLSEWSNWFGAPRSAIEGVYKDWAVGRGWTSTGVQ